MKNSQNEASGDMRSKEYREKAAACLLAAKNVASPDARNRMLAMAQAWNRLADEAERMAIHERLGRSPIQAA